jgi:hypothetical protein
MEKHISVWTMMGSVAAGADARDLLDYDRTLDSNLVTAVTANRWDAPTGETKDFVRLLMNPNWLEIEKLKKSNRDSIKQ